MKITFPELRLKIRNSLMENQEILKEGPNDPGIFKAIFMAGCPGSGKGTVLKGIFGTDSGSTYQGLKIINSDKLYEFLLSKGGLGLSQPDHREYPDAAKEYQSASGKYQSRAVQKTTGGSRGINPENIGLDSETYGLNKKSDRVNTVLENAIESRLGLVLDGTAANFDRIVREKKILEDLGYQTMMIAVRVPLDIAVDRNRQRGKSGKRKIPTIAVTRTCEKLEVNFDKYAEVFLNQEKGDRYIEIDNTLPIDETLTPEVLLKIKKFIEAPVENQTAREWIDSSQNNASRDLERPAEELNDEGTYDEDQVIREIIESIK